MKLLILCVLTVLATALASADCYIRMDFGESGKYFTQGDKVRIVELKKADGSFLPGPEVVQYLYGQNHELKLTVKTVTRQVAAIVGEKEARIFFPIHRTAANGSSSLELVNIVQVLTSELRPHPGFEGYAADGVLFDGESDSNKVVQESIKVSLSDACMPGGDEE